MKAWAARTNHWLAGIRRAPRLSVTSAGGRTSASGRGRTRPSSPGPPALPSATTTIPLRAPGRSAWQNRQAPGAAAPEPRIGKFGPTQAGLVGAEPALQRRDRDAEVLLAHGPPDGFDRIFQQRASRSRTGAGATGSGSAFSGESRPSSAAGCRARWSARVGAAPRTAATRSIRCGIALKEREDLNAGGQTPR